MKSLPYVPLPDTLSRGPGGCTDFKWTINAQQCKIEVKCAGFCLPPQSMAMYWNMWSAFLCDGSPCSCPRHYHHDSSSHMPCAIRVAEEEESRAKSSPTVPPPLFDSSRIEHKHNGVAAVNFIPVVVPLFGHHQLRPLRHASCIATIVLRRALEHLFRKSILSRVETQRACV